MTPWETIMENFYKPNVINDESKEWYEQSKNTTRSSINCG